MKKFLGKGAVVAIAAMVTVSLAACGSGGQSDSASSGSTTLNLMVASYGDQTKAEWQQIISNFQIKNPGIKVKLEVQSWNDIKDVVKTKVQAGKQPDILQMDAFAGFVDGDLLYPAKDVVSPAVFSDFQDAFAKNASIKGTQYGLPFLASVRALFYNEDIFSKAGVLAPPKTWAELEAAAQKIKAAGYIGYGMPLSSFESQGETAIWIHGAGGGYGDANKLTIDTPQNLEGVNEMKKLIDQGLTEKNAGSTDRDPLFSVFMQGKVGMQIGLPPGVGQLKKTSPNLNYGIARIPTKNGSEFTLGVADHMMAFKNKTDKTASIKKFLDYFYSADVYTKFITAEGFLPTTKSGANVMGSIKTLKPFLDLLPSAVFYPAANPKWPAAQSAIQSQMGQLAQGADPGALLKSIAAKTDQ